ncbi:MAG: hypothetical protein SGCHY_004774, partial [Lobulomycetales sp.]
MSSVSARECVAYLSALLQQVADQLDKDSARSTHALLTDGSQALESTARYGNVLMPPAGLPSKRIPRADAGIVYPEWWGHAAFSSGPHFSSDRLDNGLRAPNLHLPAPIHASRPNDTAHLLDQAVVSMEKKLVDEATQTSPNETNMPVASFMSAKKTSSRHAGPGDMPVQSPVPRPTPKPSRQPGIHYTIPFSRIDNTPSYLDGGCSAPKKNVCKKRDNHDYDNDDDKLVLREKAMNGRVATRKTFVHIGKKNTSEYVNMEKKNTNAKAANAKKNNDEHVNMEKKNAKSFNPADGNTERNTRNAKPAKSAGVAHTAASAQRLKLAAAAKRRKPAARVAAIEGHEEHLTLVQLSRRFLASRF